MPPINAAWHVQLVIRADQTQASLSSPQGLYIFLVYAVYNSEVRKRSAYRLLRLLCGVGRFQKGNLLGDDASCHSGEERHQEDQREAESLVFHCKSRPLTPPPQKKKQSSHTWCASDLRCAAVSKNCSQPTSFLPSQGAPATTWVCSPLTHVSQETSETSRPSSSTSTSLVIKNGGCQSIYVTYLPFPLSTSHQTKVNSCDWRSLALFNATPTRGSGFQPGVRWKNQKQLQEAHKQWRIVPFIHFTFLTNHFTNLFSRIFTQTKVAPHFFVIHPIS